MLFQIDVVGSGPDEVFPSFWAAQPTPDDTRAFAESLVHGVTKYRRWLDRAVASCSEHWRVERMAVVDRNVLRMAVFELVFDPDTPRAVVIDEAIEVAKRFGGEESGAFVNGLLDAVRRGIERGEVVPPTSD